MTLLWLLVWTLAGMPSVGGWWLATLILAATTTFQVKGTGTR